MYTNVNYSSCTIWNPFSGSHYLLHVSPRALLILFRFADSHIKNPANHQWSSSTQTNTPMS